MGNGENNGYFGNCCSLRPEIKLKLRSIESSEHINEKGDGPYRGFDY